MTAMFIIFHTGEYDQPTRYNNWNFINPPQFDEFWFNDTHTQFLYHALNYEIGKD